jgi:hypothetical protein
MVLGTVVLGFTPGTAPAQKRQRDAITREELDNAVHRDHDLYRAVRALRPHFLAPPRGNRTMGNTTVAPILLYVDGVQQGDVETLRMIRVADVEEVRYLEPSKAQIEYGPKNSSGAVLVKLRKKLQPAEAPLADPPRRDTTPGQRT